MHRLARRSASWSNTRPLSKRAFTMPHPQQFSAPTSDARDLPLASASCRVKGGAVQPVDAVLHGRFTVRRRRSRRTVCSRRAPPNGNQAFHGWPGPKSAAL